MTVEPLVLLSALEHHLYCARQSALIHVDGLWAENASTVAGTRAHRRVDTAPGRRERGRLVLRGLPLYSERYGLSGRADAVEVQEDGTPLPVEYKAGGRHGQAADVQLCAQALCLEEMTGREVPIGLVWYGGPRRRQVVDLDSDLRSSTLTAIAEVRETLVSGVLPPAVADERCRECQLEPVCMPRVVVRPKAVLNYLVREVFECG